MKACPKPIVKQPPAPTLKPFQEDLVRGEHGIIAGARHFGSDIPQLIIPALEAIAAVPRIRTLDVPRSVAPRAGLVAVEDLIRLDTDVRATVDRPQPLGMLIDVEMEHDPAACFLFILDGARACMPRLSRNSTMSSLPPAAA